METVADTILDLTAVLNGIGTVIVVAPAAQHCTIRDALAPLAEAQIGPLLIVDAETVEEERREALLQAADCLLGLPIQPR